MIEQIVRQELEHRGFDLHYRWNTLQPPYSDQGWPLALPEIQWQSNTRLVLHFQDRITPTVYGCRELEQIEQHYGSWARQIVVIYYSHGLDKIYTGPIQLVEFSTHNWLTISDILKIQDQWLQAFDQPKTQSWQCLNGRICDHRRRAAAVLQHWKDGVLSLGNKILLEHWDYSTYRGTENYTNFVRLLPVYQRCKVNIVTETDYDARPGVICEKTLYAFVAKQIPIVIGHPGAVQDCRNLGFDMFDDVVDTSYDWIDNSQRVETALNLNKDFVLANDKLNYLDQRLAQNQKHALHNLISVMATKAKHDLSKVF